MFNPINYFFRWTARRLSNRGLIDTVRGERISDLAWPRTLTMFARFSQRTADVAMVGLTVGPAGIAGIAFATIYWRFAVSFSGGLVGGTISQVSQTFGAGKMDRLDLTVKQSVWAGLAIATPFVLLFWFFTEPLIALVASDSATIGYGATYLQVQSFGLIFLTLNLISSRTLAGADDTWLTMMIRSSGAVVNLILNGIFIFGLGMGVMGAALGTVLAEGLVTVLFAFGFFRGRMPGLGEFPVKLSPAPPYFDLELSEQLLRMSFPLMMKGVAQSAARFPLLAILGVFGPTVVAAYEVARRVRNQLNATGRGFSMASSSLVGQELGREDEANANNFATDLITFSTVIYTAGAAVVIVFAPQLSLLFVDEPSAVDQVTPFIRVAAISFVGYGLNETFTGILKAAGDNNWTMYGQFLGQYFILLPITYLGTVTPLGIVAVYIALIAETWSTALVTGYRYLSGTWLEVNKSYRPTSSDD